MNHFFLILLFLITATIVIYLYRVLRGPTVFDRLLGLNGIATATIVLLVLIGSLYARLEMFIDIGLSYALINLIGSLAAAKYLEKREGQAP